MKNIDEYQTFASGTAIYPDLGSNIDYPTLGLCGEAGEVAEKVKKMHRDNDGELSIPIREDLILELGNVMWYVAMLANEIDVDLSTVLENNIEKLNSRKERGTLKGSGDNR